MLFRHKHLARISRGIKAHTDGERERESCRYDRDYLVPFPVYLFRCFEHLKGII